MKIFIVLFLFLFSVHQTPVSAMMLSPFGQQLAEDMKEVNCLRAQKRINEQVCMTAPNIYEKINNNWTYVLPHKEMSVDSPYWEAKRIKRDALFLGKKQKVKAPTLILKTSPEHIIEALEDLINKPAKVECTIALDTVKLFCMKALLGNSCFTKYAEGIYTLLGQKEGFTTEQFFHELPFQFLEMKGGSAIPGSIAYITNIPQYLHFKPSGNEAGDNIFYIADNQCLGFGSNYKKGPQSWQAVEKELFRSLCDPTDVEYLHDEHKNLSSYYQADQQAFEIDRRTEQQENCNFHYIFDAEKIKRFRKTGEVIL